MNDRLHRRCGESASFREGLSKLAHQPAPAKREQPAPPPAAPPCVHRSLAPIAKEPCLPCQGRELVDVFACASPEVPNGRCTVHPTREAKRAKPCRGCNAIEAPPMDAVYFFRQSGAGDEELRYSLRSLERFAPWARRVWILGERPRWFVESDRVSHLPWDDLAAPFGWKSPLRNAFLMFVAATGIPDLAEEFLSLSDDFVLVRPLSREEAAVPRRIEPLTKPTKLHKYRRFAWRTWETLKKLGIPPANFDCHCPMRFTKAQVLAAYADLKAHLSEERYGGLLNKTAILSHAMKREGFVPVSNARAKFRCGFWGAPPTREQLEKAVAEPSVLFLNFDDAAYGPTIAGFLRERFPTPAEWEATPEAAVREKGLHVHVVKHSEWIIGRIADSICCSRTTVSRRPDPAADVNLYVHYRAMKEPVPGTLNVAWFTHLEESGKKRAEFFRVAERADWCLAMSSATAKHLPPEKTSIWYGAPDREFVKPTIRLGVAVKPGPRKGLEKLDAIRGIPGVEVTETKGELPLADLPAFFRSIDYLIVTSDLEGGPYCVPEAIASGKPVIAPDVGFCWDFRSVIRYDGTAEDLAAVVRQLRFPPDPWAAASRELEAILRDVLTKSKTSPTNQLVCGRQ